MTIEDSTADSGAADSSSVQQVTGLLDTAWASIARSTPCHPAGNSRPILTLPNPEQVSELLDRLVMGSKDDPAELGYTVAVTGVAALEQVIATVRDGLDAWGSWRMGPSTWGPRLPCLTHSAHAAWDILA